MESVLASTGSDFLPPPLAFGNASDQASYILSRRETTIFAPSRDYGPNHVRTVVFRVADSSSFHDLSTLVFVWDVHNEDTTNALQPLSAIPHCCFNRQTVRVSSTLVEDVCFSAKAEELWSRFMPRH